MGFIAKQRGREVLEQQRRLSVGALGREPGLGEDELPVENIAYVKRSGGEAFTPSPSRGRR